MEWSRNTIDTKILKTEPWNENKHEQNNDFFQGKKSLQKGFMRNMSIQNIDDPSYLTIQ